MDSSAIFALGHDLPLIYRMFHGFQELDVPSEKGDFLYLTHIYDFFLNIAAFNGFHYICVMFSSTINDCNKLTFEVNLPSEQ